MTKEQYRYEFPRLEAVVQDEQGMEHGYSCRNATVGSTFIARRAGK